MTRKLFCRWECQDVRTEKIMSWKGKGGILGDLFNRHQGQGSGGYKYCKGACKCCAGALKDGCLKKKGEAILNQQDQDILPGEHTVDRPSAGMCADKMAKVLSSVAAAEFDHNTLLPFLHSQLNTTCDRACKGSWSVRESRASKSDSPKHARRGGDLQWASRVNRTRQKHSQSAEEYSNWL